MKNDTKRDYHERILRTLIHIQEHLGEVMPLEDLAKIAHFSPFHFHRVFRGMVGESVHAHIRRLRLERAAHHLKFSEQPITKLAFDAGYETLESFSRAFSKMFDHSPSSFREQHRSLPFPQTPSGVHYAPEPNLDSFEPLEQDTPFEVGIVSLPTRRVAFVRHRGRYSEVGPTWEKLMLWARSRGLFASMVAPIGICYDDPEVTSEDNVRYDAALVVGDGVQAEGEVGLQTLEGGEFAHYQHRGPYDAFPDIYARLCGEWAPSNDRPLLAGPSLEVYRNHPGTTPPEDLLTDIFFPLEPRRGSGS